MSIFTFSAFKSFVFNSCFIVKYNQVSFLSNFILILIFKIILILCNFVYSFFSIVVCNINFIIRKFYLSTNWHLYWFSFYYHRKHYGFLVSFKIHFSKLLRFFFMKNIYFFTNNNKLRDLYQARLNGLIYQILDKSSFSGLILK